MSKLVKFFAIAVLMAGALAMTPGPAAAQHHGGHVGGSWHGGGGSWHGGGVYWRGGGWRGGGWGPGFGWGWGVPYYGGYYYDEPGDCGWVRVRVWRNHHRVWRRVWRCW